jgi:hypothetical protein
MKKENLIHSIYQGILTAAIVAIASPHMAFAATDLTTTVSTVQSSINNIPQVIAGAFYIGGAAMTGAGLLQLKAHAENPAQNPLGKGMGRLAAGAGLLALPAMSNWVNNTLNLGSQGFSEGSLGSLH